jgi:octaprenyl-diphosphate synthase
MIHFLRTAPREHRLLLRSLLEGDDSDKVQRIVNLILPSQSVAYARNRATQMIDQACGALMELPDSLPKRMLEMMAQFVVNRPL